MYQGYFLNPNVLARQGTELWVTFITSRDSDN